MVDQQIRILNSKKQNGKDLCSIPRSRYDRRVSTIFSINGNPNQKCGSLTLYFLASTSTPKLPLSPRPNLMPFPSRETASATKHFITQLLYCDILLQYDIKSYIDRYTGLVFRSYCTFILATFCFEKLKQTST